MTYRPLHGNVLIEKISEQNTKDSNIIITPSSQTLIKGKAIAVGGGHTSYEGKNKPLTIKPDDIAYFFESDGEKIELDGKEYLIVDEDEIYLIETLDHE